MTSRFSLRFSRHWKPSSRSSGVSSCTRLRRRLTTLFPQKANCWPLKQAVAQQTKLSPMHSVFPLRTAPSQMIAS